MEAKEKEPRAPRAGRPNIRHDSFRGSFLEDHQQFKSSQNRKDQVRDGVVEAVPPLLEAPTVNGKRMSVPSRIKDSGVVYSMSHRNCQPLPSDPSKLVATLFYKSQDPVHPHFHPDTSPHPRPTDRLPSPMVAEGAAPTLDMAMYPLEPPAPEPEPLDHLYGPYVSQLCLTHFLQVLDDLPTPYSRISSSHRCLDSQIHPRVMEVTFSPAPDPNYLTFEDLRKHENIWRFEREWNVEVVLQQENIYRRYKRLAVFDMDSTLIQQEVIDEIAKFVGVEKEVSVITHPRYSSHFPQLISSHQQITARAMNGELDFSASLKARVSLLKGVPATVFDQLKPHITITPGARDLCRALKKLGFKLAVLSGGFQPLADWLKAELGLDYAFANHLEDDRTSLLGTLSPDFPVVDGARKAQILKQLAAENGILLSQVLAVGDGANDLPMMRAAGLGLAWRAKSKVQLEAPTRLNGQSMVDILFLLGLCQAEVDELLAV
jgi:phosphoserine phosphatase